MAANPQIPQGNLNCLIGSLTFPENTAYNISASYLGSEGISINPGGAVTTFLGTMTGAVQSPEPYMLVGCAVHLVRSQAFANSFKVLIENGANLGDGVFRLDTDAMDPYDFENMAVSDVRPFAMSGRDAGWMLTITGIWLLNNNLWG